MYSRGKTVERLIYSLSQFSLPEKVGDILITADKQAYNGRSFADNLYQFKQKCMRKLLPKGVSVVTRSGSGRLHSHIAVEMPEPCLDYDWISFDLAEFYYKLYLKWKSSEDLELYKYFTKKYNLSLPASWQNINVKLMKAGKLYGLGRVFLTPVRKNMKAYQWYLVSNIPDKREESDKGIQYMASWGLRKAVKFQVLNRFTADYRRRLKLFCSGLQLNSENYNIVLRDVLGSWYYKCKDLIRDIDHLSADQLHEYKDLHSAIAIHLLRSS
jgi:hypothetical protein